MTRRFHAQVGAAAFDLEAWTVLDAAEAAVGLVGEPTRRLFLAGKVPLCVTPEPADSAYPALTLKEWRKCFKRNGRACPW